MPFDLSLGLEGTHVLVTGGDGAIGKVVVEAFLQAGACVSVFDTAVKDSDYENKSPADRNSTSKTYCNKEYNQLDIKSMQPFSNIKKYLPREVQLPQSQALPYTPPTPPINNNESPGPRPCNSQLAKYYVDVSNPAAISKGFEKAISTFGIIQVCVALAATDLSYLPHHSSVADLPFEQWQSTFNVNVHGTFLTCQQWVRQVKAHAVPSTRNLSLIIIGSESGTFGERSNPDYASGKSAVQYGLVNSLKQDIVRIHPEARYDTDISKTKVS